MILKNVRLIDPANNLDEIRDITIENGKIKSLSKTNEDGIDLKGLIACPGFVDVHVHFRDPGFTYKEDLFTGTQAGIRGGYTSLICMANTNPKMDSPNLIRDFYKKAKELPIDVFTVSALTKNFDGENLVDMEGNLAAGALGFTDDGIPNTNSNLVLMALKKAKNLNVPVSFHEEDPKLIKENGINHGKISESLGLYGSPAISESLLVLRDGFLSLKTGAKVEIQHISAGDSVEIVREFKKRGANLYAEVTPHHFSLTEDALLKYKTLAKMNPPLRNEKDRLKIIEGMKDGTIEIIATDHAPHSKEEKEREITKAPSGILGLETALSLGIENLVDKGHLTLNKLIEMMTINPARLYNLDAGHLSLGSRGNITIFDPNEKWVYKKSYSKSENSPFLGQTLKGKVKMTIFEGKVIFDDSREK